MKLIILAGLTLLWGSQCSAAITYVITPIVVTGGFTPLETVTGTITTDGTITSPTTPYLSSSNIIAWNFSLTAGSDPPISLSNTSQDAFMEVLGPGLTASDSQLFFNFSDLNSEIGFGQPEGGVPVFIQLYFQGPTSNFGGVPAIAFHACEGTQLVCFGDTESPPEPFAATVIATAATVPEPTAWAMIMAGVGGIGAMLRRSRRRAVAPRQSPSLARSA